MGERVAERVPTAVGRQHAGGIVVAVAGLGPVAVAVADSVVIDSGVARRAGAEAQAHTSVSASRPPLPIVGIVVIAVTVEGPLEGTEQLLVFEVLRREGLVQARKGRVVARDDGSPPLGPPRRPEP
jgi:hypothetical protein